MAVGTVSGVDPQDNWQLISSVTPSTGTVTFSSVSGYKTLLLSGKAVLKSGSDTPLVRLNGDTSATAGGSYGVLNGAGTTNYFIINGASSIPQAFAFTIYNANQSVPHRVTSGYAAAGQNGSASDYYTDPTPITSISLMLDNGQTFSGGTVYLYGIAA
jgi:hypothetical protein